MRASAGTKPGLAASVVACTNSRIACFAGPSFQDGSGSGSAHAATAPDSTRARTTSACVNPPGPLRRESAMLVTIAGRSRRRGQGLREEGQALVHPVVDRAVIVGEFLVAMGDAETRQGAMQPARAEDQ